MPSALDISTDKDTPPKTSKAQLLNRLSNTAVLGALVGGFAFGNLAKPESLDGLEFYKYILAFIAVHACICTSITSALLYRNANDLGSDEEANAWAKKNWFLVSLPMAKFGMGLLSYLLSVVLRAWMDLKGSAEWQLISLVIGLMGICMTFTLGLVTTLKPSMLAP